MRKSKNGGQTVVVGSLLLLGLVVSVIIYVQLSILPDINKQTEIDSQDDAVENMIELRSASDLTLSTGTPQTVLFDNYVSYLPQPASPPNQRGQLNFIKGQMRVNNAEYVPPENINCSNTTDPECDKDFTRVQYNNATTILTYDPSYIELSDNRTIKIDNTVIYENNPQNNAQIRYTEQSFIAGNQINLNALLSEKSGIKSPNGIDVTLQPNHYIQDKIQGDNNGTQNIEVVLSTSLSESEWEERLQDQANVLSVSVDVNDQLRVELDGSVEYRINFAETRIRL